MAELDGVWKVERAGGVLPPLVGVVKRIAGSGGETRIGAVRMKFEVRGHELRYRPPFFPLVDVLEPAGAGFDGRATLLGREIGTFTLRRIEMADALKEQLIKHIDEAYAMEQNVLRMLDSMISTTKDAEIVDELENHKLQTEGHADRMKARLQANGGSPSVVKEAGGILGALAKMPLDLVRGEKAGRNARDAYATEHLEIAGYELLTRIAEKAGDAETASAAREIIEEERAMAKTIEANWDKFAALSLAEEGIPA